MSRRSLYSNIERENLGHPSLDRLSCLVGSRGGGFYDMSHPLKIAVASGKGGTGKTTIAVSLALAAAASGKSVQYLDCDAKLTQVSHKPGCPNEA